MPIAWRTCPYSLSSCWWVPSPACTPPVRTRLPPRSWARASCNRRCTCCSQNGMRPSPCGSPSSWHRSWRCWRWPRCWLTRPCSGRERKRRRSSILHLDRRLRVCMSDPETEQQTRGSKVHHSNEHESRNQGVCFVVQVTNDIGTENASDLRNRNDQPE